MSETIILLHLAAALIAIALGLRNLMAEKGTPIHKKLGWIWVALMAGLSLVSFSIQEINPGGFSWIHGLSIFVLINLVLAIRAIRQGKVARHRSIMLGVMAGLLIAGLFALAPGRAISGLFGYDF